MAQRKRSIRADDLHLGTADNGNVYAILNNRDATRSAAYSYDPLNRIATAETSESALWGQSFGYDAWGNLLTQTVTQGTAPPLNVTVNGKNQITLPLSSWCRTREPPSWCGPFSIRRRRPLGWRHWPSLL